MFRLWYYCSNQGDGSVAVHFFNNEKDANEADEAQSEGWGESSVSCVDLVIKDGKICMPEYTWNKKKKQNDITYLPLKEEA